MFALKWWWILISVHWVRTKGEWNENFIRKGGTASPIPPFKTPSLSFSKHCCVHTSTHVHWQFGLLQKYPAEKNEHGNDLNGPFVFFLIIRTASRPRQCSQGAKQHHFFSFNWSLVQIFLPVWALNSLLHNSTLLKFTYLKSLLAVTALSWFLSYYKKLWNRFGCNLICIQAHPDSVKLSHDKRFWIWVFMFETKSREMHTIAIADSTLS